MDTNEIEASPGQGKGEEAPADRHAPSGSGTGSFAHKYALVGVFLLIVVLFSLLRPHTFPTLLNAQTIASSQAVIAVLALGALMPLVVGQFDISVGYQLGFAQVLCAGLIVNSHWSAGLASVAAVASCVFVGCINGLLVTRVRLNSFIVTLGTGTLLLGFNELYGNDMTIQGPLPSLFTDLGHNAAADVPLLLIFVLIVAIILWIALEYTAWGRECHATGDNPRAALLAGVRTDRRIMQCFALGGLLSGISGVMSVMVLEAASSTVGLGELLPAFAGAFLGATSIRPGRFNAIGTIIAVYLLTVGITGLQQLGAAYYVQDLFNGGALLIAVLLSAFVARGRQARAS